MAVLVVCLPWVLHLLKIPGSLAHTASVLIFATAGTFMVTEERSNERGMGSDRDSRGSNRRHLATQRAWYLFAGMGLWGPVHRRNHPDGCLLLPGDAGINGRLRLFDRATLRIFFGYGSVVQVSGLLCTFLYSIEKVLAGVFIGVQATGAVEGINRRASAGRPGQ